MTLGSSARHFRHAAISAVCLVMLLAATPVFADNISTNATTTLAAVRTTATASATIGTATPVYDQAVVEKQARVDEFKKQLEALDRELEIASQDYNAAADRIAELNTKVQVAQTDLENARQAYEIQSAILSQRAAANYKDGNLGVFEVLLNSKSMSDFVARVKFLNTIGLADADIAASLKAQKEQMELQVADLESAKLQAESLTFQMDARRIEVQTQVEERQTMVAEAQKDLLYLLDTEAGRRAADESALISDAMAGTSKAGIVVDPGSPVETALAYRGIKYVWAGATPSGGFDCSGLILYVYAQHGVTLPHYSGSQFLLGTRVAAADLLPGDVVFFGNPIHHVGMYIGGGYFLHAPRTGDVVKISKLADRSDYAGARRYPWQPRVGAPLGAVSTTTSALGSIN